jgi:hypothetical protein
MPQPPLTADSATDTSPSFPAISGISPEASASFWLSDPPRPVNA